MQTNSTKYGWILISFFSTFIWQISPSHAATFNVTNGTELQSALTTAQNNNEPDTINLAPGNYDASGGTFTYLADNTLGSEENFPLTLIGSGVGKTILDGGGVNQIMSLATTDGITPFNEPNGDIQVSEMTFQKANATMDSGGGLLIVTNQADAAVQNCEFLNNHSDDFAGGLDIQTVSGNILLNASVFTGNDSTEEISATELFTEQGSIVATNNIFFDNHSFNSGISHGFGALFVSFVGGNTGTRTMDIINNTITGNTATTPTPSDAVGGGLYVELENAGETANIFNNIVFGNSTNNAAGQGGDDIFIFNNTNVGVINLFNNDFTQICLSANNVQVADTCDPVGFSINFGGLLMVDPLLVDPAGGNFNLAANSPVIDKGDSAAPSLPSTDQAGNSRTVGGTVDMGALEFQPPPPSGGGCALTSPDILSQHGKAALLILTLLLLGIGGISRWRKI